MSESATFGDCVVLLVDQGLDTERVVVERADELVLASPELVAEWRSGNAPHVRLHDNCATFGTPGEGLGVVTYEIEDGGARFSPPIRQTHYALHRRRAGVEEAG